MARTPRRTVNTEKKTKPRQTKPAPGKQRGSKPVQTSTGQGRSRIESVLSFLNLPRTRTLFLSLCFFIGLLYLLINLFLLQVIHGHDQEQAQKDQIYSQVEIPAQRGNIYDRNGNLLVRDSSAKAVCVIPYDIREGETDSLLSVLVEKLGVDPEETMEKLSRLENDIVELADDLTAEQGRELAEKAGDGIEFDHGVLYVIPNQVKDVKKAEKVLCEGLEMKDSAIKARVESLENSPIVILDKVDNLLAESIQKSQSKTDKYGNVDYNGVELLEDKMRYYTNGKFASNLLGFTGDDHSGLLGVEATYNDVLAGTNGIALYLKDSNGKTISTGSKIIQEAIPGSDISLTIDSNIQIEAEKQLAAAVSQWHAKSGTAIVMNCKTGEILAMAQNPTFDLNAPYKIDETWLALHAKEVQGLEDAEILQQMWRNQATGLIYEPGSTFKPITVCTALEEGAIDPNLTVTCTGSISVSGVTINCTGVHGTQTIAQTLENSCNPGLVQIIQNLDPETFYRYVYDFGFGENTGLDLVGEEAGIINRVTVDEEGDFNMLDYSTYSFGQGLAVTPIQLIAALNCVINDGQYVVPHLNNELSSEKPRQVISKETSAVLREDLETVVTGNTSLAQQAKGYSIGGKSGTAQKFVDGAYSNTRYVTSYFSFSSIEDPEYCVLVLLDEPDSHSFGSTSAGPACIAILEQVLNYNGLGAGAEVDSTVLVPELVGLDADEAGFMLDSMGITYEYTYEKDQEGNWVRAQSIKAGSVYKAGEKIYLTVGEKLKTPEGIPDLTGLSIQAANEKLQSIGMKLKVKGSGFAVSQSPVAGSKIDPGKEVLVTFE